MDFQISNNPVNDRRNPPSTGPLTANQQEVVDQIVAVATNGETPVQKIIVGYGRYVDDANAAIGSAIVAFEQDCFPNPGQPNCVHGTHFHVDFGRPPAQAPAPAAAPLFQPAAPPVFTSTASGFGSDTRLYYRFQLANGFEIAGRSNLAGKFSEVLSPNTDYTLTVYQASTNRWAVYHGRSNASGAVTDLGTLILDQFGGPDTDGDGLPDMGELAIGTDPTKRDTDGDGLTDDAEITQGLDPLDNRGFPTGIISSLPLRGEAKEVVLEGSPTNPTALTAYVATGSHGLAIVDASQFNAPIILGQLDLPGDATDVSVDPNLKIAVVAANTGGLHFIDISDPMQPVLLRTINANSNQVE